jgi:hypothetical protein
MRSTRKGFAREPFQFTARADWEDGKLQTEVAFDVPKSKRLVIENVSATLECPVAQDITSTQIRTSVANVVAWHSLFVPRTATFENTFNLYCGGQRVRVYADAGTTVAVLVHRNANQCTAPCGTTMVFISGYLLSVQSPSLAP